jgi:ABC-2 type transport system ATP-binding protein
MEKKLANTNPNFSDDATFSITLTGLVKKYAKSISPALDNISAQFKRGYITGLVGPDGAGKTTLVRIIAGLLSPTEGQLTVEGFNPTKDAKELHTILGYMPQKFGLYEELTVMENLLLYAELKGVVGNERTQMIAKLLDFTSLGPFTRRLAGKLSGGMKQKLGLACTLLGRTQVLLLDEPSFGVDPISRRELWSMVNNLLSEKVTVIWSTSYLEEAESCHEVLLLNEGKLAYYGPPQIATQKIIGRTVQIDHIQGQGNRRQVLKNALYAEEVKDAGLQASQVHLLLKERGKLPNLASLKAGPTAIFTAVDPRFEDAFMDRVGGAPKGGSVLANMMPPVHSTISSDIAIEVEALTKLFGTFVATDHITFKVKRGEIFGLLGPNGAGKSTTFRMMCGLLLPTSGTIRILGINLQENPPKARQHIGYMAQKFSLYGNLSVQQNLQFFSGIYGLTGKYQAERIDIMTKIFGLKPYLKSTTQEMPMGFKQRLALACAIMHEPLILFLDEPTSGVDPVTRREFWMHINALVEKGITIMVTTHFMDEAENCDRIGLVYRGQLIAMGTPEELKQLAASEKNPKPTIEDTFIELVTQYDQKTQAQPEPVSPAIETTPHEKFEMQENVTARHRSFQRWLALCRKEFYQIIRDPSIFIGGFVLPVVMLFLFGFGINLDYKHLPIGLLLNNNSAPEARDLARAFYYSPYIKAKTFYNESDAANQLLAGNIKGFASIQSNFDKQLKQLGVSAPLQIITDGSQPNTAEFVKNYALGAWQIWQQLRIQEVDKPATLNIVETQPRYWFNPAAISKFYLIPGSIAIIMTVTGALLTSLVIAREWESGTMEALLSTAMTRHEFFFSKLIPYYLISMLSMFVCFLLTRILGVPYRGSIWILFIETSLFLGSALGLGLLLSTTLRNQFNAAQAALNIAYLPAVILSGYAFEISSMPKIIQAVTYLIPARYFVTVLHTLYLAGDIGLLLLKTAIFLLVSALIFLALTMTFTRRTLD